jgi:hypothetical protein
LSNKTYTQLSDNLQAWLEDDDAEFTGSIPEVIDLGQMRLWRDLDLSIFSSESTTPTVASTETLLKPVADTELVTWQSLYYDNAGERTRLELRSTDFVRDYKTPGSTAPPKNKSEQTETDWLLAPIPDGTYTVNTRGTTRLSPLVETTNETNWLSLHQDDLLFKACLAEAEGFLKSDDRVAQWMEQYATALPMAKRECYTMLQERYNLTPLEVPAVPTNQR